MGRPKLPTLFRSCVECGAEFELSRNHKEVVCCSKRCAGIRSAKTKTERYGPGWFNGPNNPRYNGGLCTYGGRTLVCCRDGSIVLYSRVLMEGEIGRPLTSEEIVHHIDGDCSNDVVENLEIVTRAEHIEIHRAELLAARGIAA